MEDYTRKFIDVISKINYLGKDREFRKGALTQSEFNDYKNLHNIRNGCELADYAVSIGGNA